MTSLEQDIRLILDVAEWRASNGDSNGARSAMALAEKLQAQVKRKPKRKGHS